MSSFYLALIWCSLTIICTAMNLHNDNRLGDSQTIKDIEAFRAQNPDILGGVTNFYFGNRTSHDVKIAESSKVVSIMPPQNLYASIVYPSKSDEDVMKVTYVEIAINTTSPVNPKVYITSGGIGQKNIQIAIEATLATNLSYNSVLYSEVKAGVGSGSANRTQPLIYFMAILLILFVSSKFIKV